MISSYEAIVELYDKQYPNALNGIAAAEWKGVNRDCWAALVDRTTGEAASKVDSSGQGQGLFAYVKLRRRFAASTGIGKVECRAKLKRPEQCNALPQ